MGNIISLHFIVSHKGKIINERNVSFHQINVILYCLLKSLKKMSRLRKIVLSIHQKIYLLIKRKASLKWLS